MKTFITTLLLTISLFTPMLAWADNGQNPAGKGNDRGPLDPPGQADTGNPGYGNQDGGQGGAASGIGSQGGNGGPAYGTGDGGPGGPGYNGAGGGNGGKAYGSGKDGSHGPSFEVITTPQQSIF